MSFMITFVIEPINTIDGGAFMIATEDEKVFWILDLVGEQQANRLQALPPPIHIIPKE